ncbi:hypothetical protein PP744_gp091 [Rhizobium phage RHph_N38]|uniref:Uncharacterized protein n=1 Tax=Rhizobium phage RHph_N38 TaxID=2509750 RepID=A0A7S5RDM8_9CAUD|nr:hypothetical protein PP744_gp091 [Rhizobium phage RHph_N38]QIG70564.1 hypothetical protein EVB89_103 [Rhizobium phage RHph_N38]
MKLTYEQNHTRRHLDAALKQMQQAEVYMTYEQKDLSVEICLKIHELDKLIRRS